MKTSKNVRFLVEAAMLIALGTVLSLVKIVEMPYGGSVTTGSMLPLVILAYRHGTLRGLGAGLVYATLQQLLGLNTLSYVTGWQSVVAVILLDYIIAFALVGLGGIFRRAFASQKSALVLGAVLVCVLRYVCHVISGATVWKGLSIPTEAALIYSLGYNATYMIPEAIILVALTYYVGDAIDFTRDVPIRQRNGVFSKEASILPLISGGVFLAGIITDVCLIAPKLQDAETGAFTFSGLADANWLAIGIITAAAVTVGVILLFIAKRNAHSEN